MSPPSLRKAHSFLQITMNKISPEQDPIEQPLKDGSSGCNSVDQVSGDDNSDTQERHSVNKSEVLSNAEFDRRVLMQNLTSTMHELH